MREEGSDLERSGPSLPSEREMLRRRLYERGGVSAEDLARYRDATWQEAEFVAPLSSGAVDPATPSLESNRVDASARRGGVVSEVPGAKHEAGDGDEVGDEDEQHALRPPRRHRQLILAATLLLAGASIALTLNQLGPPALPERLSLPPSTGMTLLGYSRMSNPESFPSAVTFEPADHSIYDPQDRRVGIVLRCVGEGRVLIYAGTRFNFVCTDHERTQRRITRSIVHVPFTIYGRTVGNVVWSLRVVAL